jgi:uncharacterized protein (TIGR02996 family)
MTDDPFLQAVLDDPDDDRVRLVYADRLEERGEAARAELIRVQCRLEKLSPRADRALELARLANDLLADHEEEWLGEWAGRLVRWEFRRGFLHDVTITPAAFARHGAALLHEHPVYRFSFVNDQGALVGPEAVEGIVGCPHLAAVRALDLTAGNRPSVFSRDPGSPANPAWAQALAGARHVGRLEELTFSSSVGGEQGLLSQEDLRALASAEHLRSLRRLDLGDDWRNTNVTAAALGLLASASFAGRLEALGLRYCPVGDDGVARLAQDRAFAGLRRLDLESCEVTARAVQAVLNSRTLKKLTDVRMDFQSDLPALAASPRLARFRSLGLERGDLESPAPRPADWIALGQSPHLKLRALSLDVYEVTQKGFEGLLNGPGLAGLHELRCHGVQSLDCRFLPAAPAAQELAVLDLNLQGYGRGIAWLADWPGLARLRELAFADCKGLGKDLPKLLDSPHWEGNLTALSLTYCELTPEGLAALANCPGLERLKSLVLNWQNLDKEAVEALATSPFLQRLERLHIAGTKLHKVAGDPLARPERLPRLRDVAISSTKKATAPEPLRNRFGPRVRLYRP